MASELRQGCDYSLFKKGIRPMWEDEANRKGGRWLISLEKKQRLVDLDRFWLDIVSILRYNNTLTFNIIIISNFRTLLISTFIQRRIFFPPFVDVMFNR